MLIEEPVEAPTISEQDDAISRQLVEARLNTRPLSGFPDRLPTSLQQAYAIQSASIARWPDTVVGWKVAMLSPSDQERFGAERLAGPIFRSTVRSAEPGTCTTFPVYAGGFAAVEAEFIIELGETVHPSTRDYSDDELVSLVSAFHAGAEIASSPMATINQLGPMCIISDFGNNAGILVGPSIADWSSRPLDSLTAKVIVDDVVVGDASAKAIPGGPLQALRFLIGHFGMRGVELPKGTLVSTGAATGVHDVELTTSARIDYGSIGQLDFKFETMTPKQ